MEMDRRVVAFEVEVGGSFGAEQGLLGEGWVTSQENQVLILMQSVPDFARIGGRFLTWGTNSWV